MSAFPLSAKLGLTALAAAFAIGCSLILLEGDDRTVLAADEPEVAEEPAPLPEASHETAPPPPAQQPVPTTDERIATKGPRIRVGDTRLDFGVVAVGQELQQTFVLHNDGDADLEIQKAKASCGCAALHFDKVIPAGGEGQFEVRISGKSVRAGQMSHRIEIEANDPNFWLMTIRAKVDPSLPAAGPVAKPGEPQGH